MPEVKEVKKCSTLKERVITIILIICFLSWFISIANIRVYQLRPLDFGPFQYLSFFFWLALIITCYLNLIPTNKSNKIFSMILIGVMTVGTLSVIEPYGRLYDSWQNVAVSKLVIQEGTINFGLEYVQSYPELFVLYGILQEISDISVKSTVRFTPLIMMIGYLLGTLVVIKSVSSIFNDNEKDVLNITSISYMFLTIFGLSLLDLRTNAAPQSMAYILFFNIIFLYFRKEVQSRLLCILLTIALVLTHFTTPLVMFFAFLGFLLGYSIFKKKQITKTDNKISSIIFPFTVFLSWSVFVSISFLKFATLRVKNLFELEQHYSNVAMIGSGLAYNNSYITTFRQIVIIIVGFLLICSFVFLIKKKRSLGITLGLFGLSMAPGFIFYIVQSEFTTRILQYFTLPASLIFGFGIYELLKTEKKYVYYSFVLLIIIASVGAIFTSNNGDIYEGIAYSDYIGSKFIVDHTDTKKLIYHSRLATDDYSTLWYVPPLNSVNKDIYKIILGLKDSNIVISDRWLYKQSYIEKTDNSSIKLIEDNFSTNKKVSKIYNHGQFRIYKIKQY